MAIGYPLEEGVLGQIRFQCLHMSLLFYVRQFRRLTIRDRADLLGNVYSNRTPGDTASTTNASAHTKLLMPRAELMGQPLTVAGGCRRANTATMDVRKVQCETRVPFASTLRVLSLKIGTILDCRAKAGWANHGAVSASHAALGDPLPLRMLHVATQKSRQLS